MQPALDIFLIFTAILITIEFSFFSENRTSRNKNTIFRLDDPSEPWFDNEWYPSEAVLVE